MTKKKEAQAGRKSCPFNPGYLKLLLASHGMRVEERIAGEIEQTLKTRRGVSGGVELILPGDVWVNVPTEEEFAHASPLCLTKEGERFFLTGYGDRLEVSLLPQPDFYEKVTSRGTPYYQIAVLHGGEVHITPTSRCSFFELNANCVFCHEREKFLPIAREFITVEEVVEIVEAAFEDNLADSVELNIGYYDSEDRGILHLEPYIKAIKRNFDTLVSVDVQPPAASRWIDRTYAMGADKISYHMEIFNKEIFKKLCPGKEKEIGWERFAEALNYAAGIFPSGTVSSNLIVGLEPAESTIQGIDYLTTMGIMPILPIFRPLKGTPLHDTPVPEVDDMAPIFGHLYNAVKKSKMNMSWSKSVSTHLTPLESRFFAGEDARLQVVMQNIYKTKVGGKAVRGYTGLRRRLKVKEVEDSFESSGL
ncbi:MAG: hypothetical protein OEV42_16700 [Deltaproteobacteria bacterium]|nr:hypothetical protein [Deltaproteobacteria bacterium]